MPMTSAAATSDPSDPGDRRSVAGSSGRASHVRIERDDGASLYIELLRPDAAKGPAILVLDGIGCSGWAFRQILPLLGRSHKIALMHYRGHGKSPNPPRPWQLGIDTLADDAAAALDAFELQEAVVVGFSMGFQVALELFRRHRGRVRGLVSLAGPPGRVLDNFQGTDWFGHALPFVRGLTHYAHDFTQNLWRKFVPSALVRRIGLRTQVNAERMPTADFELYFKQMAQMSPELFAEMLQQAARHCAEDILPWVDVPSLVVAGARDSFVPLPRMRELAFALPGSEWVVLPDASHALPAEYPHDISRRILDFAQRCAGSK